MEGGKHHHFPEIEYHIAQDGCMKNAGVYTLEVKQHFKKSRVDTFGMMRNPKTSHGCSLINQPAKNGGWNSRALGSIPPR